MTSKRPATSNKAAPAAPRRLPHRPSWEAEIRIALIAAGATLLSSAAQAASPTVTPAAIVPGNGTLTDAAGNKWTITQSGSIMEGNTYTPGGGGTSALTIVDGKVLGEDAHGRGWFELSGGGQYWASTPAPAGIAADPAASSVPPSVVSPSPSPATACPVTSSGQFGVWNGVIYGPNQQPWVAHGINVYDAAMGDAAQVLATFPGINFIRLATYSYQPPSYYQAFINQMTAAGVVVEIEHHVGAGGGVQPLSGSALAAENAWFASLASAYKTNPYVWFGTLNEPDDSSGNAGVLANEVQSNYAAIRGTGNNAPIMVSVNTAPPVSLSGMTGVIVDQHYYGWVSQSSTDQATVNAKLNSVVAADQQVTTATGKPAVIIGEYGPSTDGQNNDPNGNQVVSAVTGSGLGYAAWNWDSQAPADNLTQGGVLTSYGQQIAQAIRSASPQTQPTPPQVGACASAQPTGTALATDLSVLAASDTPTLTTDAPQTLPASNLQVTGGAAPNAGGLLQAPPSNLSDTAPATGYVSWYRPGNWTPPSVAGAAVSNSPQGEN